MMRAVVIINHTTGCKTVSNTTKMDDRMLLLSMKGRLSAQHTNAHVAVVRKTRDEDEDILPKPLDTNQSEHSEHKPNALQ